MEIGYHRGMIPNDRIMIHSNSYEKTENFNKYLDSLLLANNSIQEAIKCTINAGNSIYYSIQTHLSSRLLSENMKNNVYKILPGVLYDCEYCILH